MTFRWETKGPSERYAANGVRRYTYGTGLDGTGLGFSPGRREEVVVVSASSWNNTSPVIN